MPNAYSRAAKAQDDSNSIRPQKLLAQAGFGSRRKCEDMITEGRVEVDGELVTELGTRVDPHKQQVRVDGSRVRVNPNHVTLALNKPRKVLSAMDDPKGRYTLRDIVGDKYERIFHMGRLDYDSEGLILMTNDGELSQHVMHPKYEVENLRRHAGRQDLRHRVPSTRDHRRAARRRLDQARPLRDHRLLA